MPRPTRVLVFAAAASGSMAALAQSAPGTCQVSLGYVAATLPGAAPVPGLTSFSMAVLAALLGGLAWHSQRTRRGAKTWAVALWASAGLLGMQGGDGLVQAVRAAGPYEFNNPAGGTVADAAIPYASPAPLLTVTNTSGVSIRIASNANAAETGSCAVGATLAPGSSCTTAAVCAAPPPPAPPPPAPPPLQLLSVLTEPTAACDMTQPLYVKTWTLGLNSATYTIYPPRLATAPTFSPSDASVTTSIAYTQGPELIANPATGGAINLDQAAAGVLTVTALAPSGYAFDANTPPSTVKTWNLPYQQCWTARFNQSF
ncbi:midcut-by-XrtH protein [Acidovorax sp. M2(2025)]|uniref:midcut-by-XrtH protein n=1 Tax=Acidovorax sp. M2(2025) TaxID=3411355 RepID=UPI003BF482C7